MNIQSAFDGLDPEVLERIASRRDALKSASGIGAGLALASVPIALAVMAKSAFANHLPAEVVSVLNFALTLEELELEFYTRGLAANGLIPAGVRNLFGRIQQHETSHVQLLRAALGDDAIAKPTFDFTAGGMFSDVFTNYGTFLTLATAFEDTGVRAYKGQAPRLLPFDAVLLTALRIHSVEARHASAVRRLAGGYAEEGWIPDGQFGAPAAVAPVYEGEGNLSQLGVFVPSVVSRLVGDLQIAASFDEPLTMQQVLAIAGPFIVQSATLDFSTDIGVLNYAYALEQLEAAFYTRVVASPNFAVIFNDEEQRILRDLRDHEIAHREFFQAKIRDLGGTPIGALTPDFSAIDFGSRTSVLQTAQAFEDLGVSAYNGAASLIQTPNALMAAGEIVSVEARHAAVIRDLQAPKSGNFAPFAFDQALPPAVVLRQVQQFVQTPINVRNLPSS